MEKFSYFIKAMLMMITIFIVIQGILMLTIYGFSIWFFLIVLIEILLLIGQFILIRTTSYPKWFNGIYLLPFPLIYVITLFG